MKINWRLYWFLKNLSAFILTSICIIPFTLYWWIRMAKTLFITNGSETIGYPWEMDWSWDNN